MKRLYLFLFLLLSLLGSNRLMAIDLPSGVMGIGDAATTLETGKWYFLYNQGTQKYIRENTSKALKQAVSPSGKPVSANEGYLVTLEEAGNGNYYIKTGLGNYYKRPGSGANGTTASAGSDCVMTLNLISGTTNQYVIQGNETYNMIAPTSGGDIKGGTNKTANSVGAWTFYAATVKSPSELTGQELYNYQMSVLGPIRLYNKRTKSAYLTTTENGVAKGAAKTNTGLSQVWVLEKSGVGYTLRSANTGQFLQDNFAVPATGSSQKYIQFSPNNTGTEAYVNISSSQDFSGQTCMNLGNDGTTLYKWSYSGDAGSDWAIVLAEDVSLDDVRENLNGSRGYASELKEGAYYRILNTNYNVYATEVDGNDVRSVVKDDENFAQYWKLTKNGSGWAFQNVLTDNYIQPQTKTSNIFRTATLKSTLYPARTDDKWLYLWTIANASGGTTGMHTDASKNVVMWYTSNDASIWAFQEVTLTEEDIEKARGAREVYNELVANLDTYKAHLANLFEDNACTILKSNIQSLSDDVLATNADFAALNDDMKAMVLKIKNDTWQQYALTSKNYTAGYEKFFRIADYKIYSNCEDMGNGSNFTMAYSFGRLSGPTGIVANSGEIIYIYVDADPKSECVLKLECVSTDGVAGNHATGSQITLKKGLNVYCPSQQMMLYILHQLNNTQKYLADYPDIKVHIEGGMLNGYWDATRGMTDDDWALLQQDLLKAPFLNLKTTHLVFQMDAPLVKEAEPKNMEGLMRIWDKIVENEERYMGVEDFEGRYNNIWNVYSGASSYMHASTRGTWYTESTLSTVMNYANMRKPGNLWGPSHEIGHNHQGSINVIGTTESSNNLFSNINTFEQGIQTTRRQLPCDNFAALAAGTPWVGRNIWNTTSMFFQLYLYFHAMHHDDEFLPNLFRMMRKKPISKSKGEAGTYGKNDYLHLAKMICDVAQADLSEFFESYGMFVPIDKYEVDDYGMYYVTTTQADIDAAKKYMQKYPKKLGNIMFIDDHVGTMKASDPNNIFEGIPTGTKKSNNTSQHDELGNGLPIGDVGDYEKFDGRTAYETEKDICTVSGTGSSTTITFAGTMNYLGHKFYDKKGNLIWATNAKKITLPENVRNLGIENVTIVAVDANLQDIPCPYYKRNESPRYDVQMYFGNEEETKMWYANANTVLADYMPENTIGVVKTEAAPENITGTANIVNMDGTATSIVLNGDLPAYIPTDITATSVKFSKTNEGYAALKLPFAVTAEDIPGLQAVNYEGGELKFFDVNKLDANKPVVVNGNVSINLTNAQVTAGSYQELSNVKVLSANGQSVVDAEKASPFTFNLEEATGIRSIENEKMGNGENENAIYDLSGRKVTSSNLSSLLKKGLYIMNGKKVIKR